MPAVSKLAQQEVDMINLFKRTASYKVMDWDFRSASSASAETVENRQSSQEMETLTMLLKDFLQYVVVNLIDEPDHARIIVQEIAPRVLRFRLVLVKRDVAMLIGREGQTASAIRGVLKNATTTHGVNVLLLIHTHEEEAAFNSSRH